MYARNSGLLRLRMRGILPSCNNFGSIISGSFRLDCEHDAISSCLSDKEYLHDCHIAPNFLKMPFFDLFRSFFGLNRHNEPGTSGLGDHDPCRESFRNPIWQTDEDDDDIDDFRFSMPGVHFRIFSDPLQIMHYSQMDHMLKNFGFGFNDFFGDKVIDTIPFGGPENKMDNMLKEFGFEFNGFFGNKGIDVVPFDGFENKDNFRDSMLKSDSSMFGIVQPKRKIDTDLDGKIGEEEFSKLWNKKETVKPIPSNSFSGRYSTRQIIRKPDGTVEQKQVFRDSEGNQQTIISKEIGDKKYVVTTKKDKNGIETQSEDVFFMDENEQKDFTQEWTSRDNAIDGNLRHFPWEKFFDFNPKVL